MDTMSASRYALTGGKQPPGANHKLPFPGRPDYSPHTCPVCCAVCQLAALTLRAPLLSSTRDAVAFRPVTMQERDRALLLVYYSGIPLRLGSNQPINPMAALITYPTVTHTQQRSAPGFALVDDGAPAFIQVCPGAPVILSICDRDLRLMMDRAEM
jgi:hypothetical protein